MTDEPKSTPVPIGDPESARRIGKALDAVASPEAVATGGAPALNLKGGFLDSPDLVLYVQQALEADLTTRDARIDIIARARTITLLGTVATQAVMQAAEHAARSVAGVAEVDNQLVLANGEPLGFASENSQRDTGRD